MKKYLINGAMALIVGGFLASCTHDDVGAPATVNDRTKSFDEMFTELYGPIAENHNWGFATVAAEPGEEQLEEQAAEERAATRAAERAETRTPAQFGWEVSRDYDTQFKRDYYLSVLNLLPEEVDAGSKLNNYEFVSNGLFKFNIIYAQTTGNDEVGYYYYNPETQTIADHTRVAFVNDIQNLGDYVEATTSKWVSQIDILGLTWHGLTTRDGADAWKRWYNPYEWSIAKTFTVNIPAGYRVGFYIKQGDNIMYSNQTLNTNDVRPEGSRYYSAYSAKDDKTFLVGLEDWTFRYNNNHVADCNDVILAVSKASNPPTIVDVDENPTPIKTPAYQENVSSQTDTYMEIKDQGRIFCEDIATAYMGVTEDIDYNDIVFDARVWRVYDKEVTNANGAITQTGERRVRYKYDISLLATGGTIEEKINGVDVHNKFGVGQSFMVNTWTPNCVSTLSGQWNTPTNVMQAADFSYTLSYDEVDPNNIGISTIPIEVKYNGKELNVLGNRSIDSEGKSTAPYKLCLPLGTQWPIERVNIQQAYSDFSNYVSSPDNLFYEGTTVNKNLYTNAPESSIQKDGKSIDDVVKIEGSASSSSWWVVWTGETTETGGLDLYDYNFASGNTLRFFGTGTINVSCGPSSNVPLISNGDGNMSEDGYVDVKIDANQASLLSGGIMVSGSNFKVTKIVVF